MELCDGNLLDYIKDKDLKSMSAYFRELALAHFKEEA